MPTSDRPTPIAAPQLDQAIAASQTYLLGTQQQGYWWAELESNVTMTAEAVLLHKIWGTDGNRSMAKAATFLRSQQRDHGGWELYYGDGGELSTSVEAYMALKLLGVPPSDPALVQAQAFILARGGIAQTRVFTKFHLALIGCYPWCGLPSIPPWLMLLPGFKLKLDNPFDHAPLIDFSPFSIYELSSWARGSTVPLIIVFDRKPVFLLEPTITLDELYTKSMVQTDFALPRQSDWTDIFVDLDRLFKLGETYDLVPWRSQGLQAAEKWIIERQEATGDWGGIMPAMLNSLLALRCLDYNVNDPIVQRGLAAIDHFTIETSDTYRVQPCVSPVWDTALVMRSLVDSGLASDHPALVRSGQWLLEQQILDYGDWAVKNPQGQPGGWAFEFNNRFYPDVDDSAVVVMALATVRLPNEPLKHQAIARAVSWIATMQCQPGGWAAFDIDNDSDWLNAHPYGDLKAMIDPNTADVTARVLEMAGELMPNCAASSADGSTLLTLAINRALSYLMAEQDSAGCWFGRWGVNYIYGTSGVLAALAAIAPGQYAPAVDRAAQWLKQCQNPDGGWGETCASYTNPALKGQGASTASQTAWAIIGLLAAGGMTQIALRAAIDRGIAYLITTQQADGTWDEAYFTGTGFPGHFYLKYHLYQQHFPLTALGRYRSRLSSASA